MKVQFNQSVIFLRRSKYYFDICAILCPLASALLRMYSWRLTRIRLQVLLLRDQDHTAADIMRLPTPGSREEAQNELRNLISSYDEPASSQESISSPSCYILIGVLLTLDVPMGKATSAFF